MHNFIYFQRLCGTSFIREHNIEQTSYFNRILEASFRIRFTNRNILILKKLNLSLLNRINCTF